LRDRVQHHRRRQRHQGEQHADQDQSAGHAEQAGQKRRRDHQEAKQAYRQRRHSNLRRLFLPRLDRPDKLSYLGLASGFLRVRMRRLLFLNGIKAFEAAARSGSFAGAGAELNVSPAAISRMVHLLEQRLGVALFERKANRLAMTAAGRAYQSGLTPIFDALASLTAQVTAPASVRVLTIGVGPTFAMRWMIPRLSDFRQHEPDIDVRITTGGAAAPFGDDWSCGIKLGDGNWPALVAEPLFAADLLPVCAPRLAAQLKRPADLRGPGLLRGAHSPDDWPSWLKTAGVGRGTAR